MLVEDMRIWKIQNRLVTDITHYSRLQVLLLIIDAHIIHQSDHNHIILLTFTSCM